MVGRSVSRSGDAYATFPRYISFYILLYMLYAEHYCVWHSDIQVNRFEPKKATEIFNLKLPQKVEEKERRSSYK